MEILRPRHKSQEHSWLLCYKSVYVFIILTLLDAKADRLDLSQMLAFVAQQALVVLVARKDVDDVPKAGPACKPAGPHVGGDQAGGDADGHAAAASDNVTSRENQLTACSYFGNCKSGRTRCCAPFSKIYSCRVFWNNTSNNTCRSHVKV